MMEFFGKVLRSRSLITLIVAYGVEVGATSSLSPELIPITSVAVQTQSSLDSSKLGLSVPTGIRVHNLDKKSGAVSFTQNRTQNQQTTAISPSTASLSFPDQNKSAPIFIPKSSQDQESETLITQVDPVYQQATDSPLPDNQSIKTQPEILFENIDSENPLDVEIAVGESMFCNNTSTSINFNSTDALTCNPFDLSSCCSCGLINRSSSAKSATAATLNSPNADSSADSKHSVMYVYNSGHLEKELQKQVHDQKATIKKQKNTIKKLESWGKKFKLNNKLKPWNKKFKSSNRLRSMLKSNSKASAKKQLTVYSSNYSTREEMLYQENKVLKSENEKLKSENKALKKGSKKHYQFKKTPLAGSCSNFPENKSRTVDSVQKSETCPQLPIQPQVVNASALMNFACAACDDDDSSFEFSRSSLDEEDISEGDTFSDGGYTPFKPEPCVPECSVNSDDTDTLSSELPHSVSVTSGAINVGTSQGEEAC